MGWKTSKPHGSPEKSGSIGRHVDIYKTNDQGKRESGAKKGKVSYPADNKIVHDINPPKK